MGGGVTIQWCPSCSAWTKSKSVSRDIIKSGEFAEPLAPVDFSYLRKLHECTTCGEGFVTIKSAKFEGQDLWKVSGELSKIRRSGTSAFFQDEDEERSADWVI